MRTLAHPSRQVHQAAAQPFQPTDVEKKHEEELDQQTVLTKRHADEHADEKQSRVLLLQAAAFRHKLRDVEAKHANQLRAVLDGQEELMRQKEELEKKIEKLEIEQREAFNSFTAQRAKQRSSHHTIVKRLGVTLQNALGGVAERKGKWFRPAKQDVTSEINGLVFTIGTMTDLLDRMMALLLEASQELELGEDYPGEEFMLARVLGSMRRRILASEKLKSGLHHQIDRRVPEILERALPSSTSIELKLDSLFDRVNTTVRDQKSAALDEKNAAVDALEGDLDAYLQDACTSLYRPKICESSIQQRVKKFFDILVAEYRRDQRVYRELMDKLRVSASNNSMSISVHPRRVDICVRSYIDAVDVRLGSSPRPRYDAPSPVV
ncbi:uncharacterized protein J4E92_008054 [Alternaria infectoria]|uniref:uncharacterized protein n=1 Tax=Alternaria infectoria TaxID=45303 RepID=UPI00221FA7B5|nr:uncharacterized protein J4E92_008054 [Alternaria infectoria]KAI4921069.1 hypothetical protein J4E92_008054 [Alternaria infectoria]